MPGRGGGMALLSHSQYDREIFQSCTRTCSGNYLSFKNRLMEAAGEMLEYSCSDVAEW